MDSEQRSQGRPEEQTATETEVLRRQLQEQEETVGKLQQQLEAATESLLQAQAQVWQRPWPLPALALGFSRCSSSVQGMGKIIVEVSLKTKGPRDTH